MIFKKKKVTPKTKTSGKTVSGPTQIEAPPVLLEDYESVSRRVNEARETGSSLLVLNTAVNELPDSITSLPRLTTLHLNAPHLVALPIFMGGLKQLRTLIIHADQLTKLPESIGELKCLLMLHIHKSRLARLPESLAELSRLQSLLVTNSELTALPESIGELKHLAELVVSGNQLKQLPESLRRVSSLRILNLDGNRDLGLPPEVLRRGSAKYHQPVPPNDILNYYFRVRARKDRRPLNEAKLILVGRGGAGKTSIVNRLVHNSFDANERKTAGIRITEWNLRLGRTENVRLNIWDFGGQEIMHATHQLFLTQRSLYLLVLNSREEGEDYDMEYWLRLIESFGGNSPVIIISTFALGG